MRKIFHYIIICLVTILVLWLANYLLSLQLPPGQTSNLIQSLKSVENVPSGEFRYGGSTTWAQIRKEVDPKIQSELSNFKLKYTNPSSPEETPGSNSGIRMLLHDELDVALSSRKLNDKEKQQHLIEKEVAIDSIAIAVNPKLELKRQGLTIDELKDIYTGKIINWKELDGPDMKITPYTRQPEDGGTVEFFLKEILKIEDEKLRAESVRDTTDGVRKVGKISNNVYGGIYYASAPEIVGQCEMKPLSVGKIKPLFLGFLTQKEFVSPYIPPYRPPNECRQSHNRVKVNIEAFRNGNYPITRKLYVIIKQNEPMKQQAGEAYANLLLTDQGQKLLEKAGFVRLH